ncbi:hypothetical protein pb186bvf_005123 [Paramecium bursaria]
MIDQQYSSVMKVSETRMQLLIQNLSSKDLKFLNNYNFFKVTKINIDLISKQSGLKFQFYSDLFISSSRSWESFCNGNSGQRRFKDYKFNGEFIYEILSSTQDLNNYLSSDFTIKQYGNEENKQLVKSNLKLKLKVIQFLLFTEITDQDIDDCFDNIQFIAYQCKNNFKCSLRGFNNFRGNIVYINHDYDQPQTLEWNMIETLFLWKINNSNPLLIPIEQCNYQRMVERPLGSELGDLYFFAIKRICPIKANTFTMNQQRRYFL